MLQYFKENPDYNNPAYNSRYGIYSKGCGLDNVMMSWGHDDYMYLVIFCTLSVKWLICNCYFAKFVWHKLECQVIINWSKNMQVAKENKTTLPSAGLFIIRYHSFYGEKSYYYGHPMLNLLNWIVLTNLTNIPIYIAALHKAGAYKHLMNEEDNENLKWLNIFK